MNRINLKSSLKNRFFFFFSAVWIFLSVFSQLQAQNYLWPTTASKHLSSSFCEYRPAHYHSAIDIKTWNREGYPVFAVADGRIYKIRISPFGYGKVMYLQLKDGRFAVYAHLKKFIPAIEKAIRQEQMKARRYSVTWQPQNWPVKRGELLAYTGQTGIGVPHLHFEIRDAHQHPLNPLVFYHNIIKDTIAPILQELLVLPLTANSTVNGSHLPQIIRLIKTAPHRYRLADSLSARGVIGLALRSYDLANGVYNKFTFYQTHLYWDGKEIFNVSYDTLDFGKTHLADVEIYYPFKVLLHKRFRKLFIESFNTLPFYFRSPGKGFLRVAHRNHRFRLVVSDFFGNKSIIEGHVQKEADFMPRINWVKKFGRFVFLKFVLPSDVSYFSFDASPDGKHWKALQYYEILDNRFTSHGMHTYFIKADLKDSNCTRLRMELRKGRERPQTCFISLSDSCALPPLKWLNAGKRMIAVADPFSCCADLELDLKINDRPQNVLTDIVKRHLEWVLPAPRKQKAVVQLKINDFQNCLFDTTFRWYALFPEQNQTFSFFDGRLQLQTTKQTVYDTLLFTLSKNDTVSPIKNIPLLSPLYALHWYPQIFRKAARLTLRADSVSVPWRNVGVCKLGSKGRLLWLGGKADSVRRSVSVNIKTLGRFLLAADTVPPVVQMEKPLPDAVLNRLKEIRFSLTDSLSGIGTDRHIKLFVDSTFVVPEWDPEKKQVTGRLDAALAAGKHRITVWVGDMAGNWTKKSLLFTIEKKR